MNKRIQREIANALKSELYNFTVSEDQDDQKYHLRFKIKEGLYRDQEHLLEIKFCYGEKKYPEYPPLISFKTKILHPNISVNGAVCVDVLSDKWSPMMGLDSVFNIILLLLEEPNLHSPLNGEASDIFGLPYNKRQEIIKKYYDNNNTNML